MRMINKVKKSVGLAAITGLMMAVSVQPALAEEKINSVSITVDLDLQDGDSFSSHTFDIEEHVQVPENIRYSFWSADMNLGKGDKAELGKTYTFTVRLYAEDDYEFRSSYGESKVNVKGATFVKATSSRNNTYLDVTLRTKPAEGILDEPDNLEWVTEDANHVNFGTVRWDAVKYAAYDLTLYRNGKVVERFTDLIDTDYNVYPYMTKEGDYHFKVRAIPEDADVKKYAERSEWVESYEIYVADDEVSDGSGQGIGGNMGSNKPVTEVGWISNGGKWYFRYPDGNYVRDTWLKVNNIWYLFGGNGEMLTGWQKAGNLYYYMDASGAMQTGWILDSGKWYFLNQSGAMHTGWLNLNNVWYYLNSSGEMCTGWVTVGNQLYYLYPDGHMAANEVIDQLFYVGPDGAWKRP